MSSKARHVATLEVGQDLDHARALWRVQRAGWIAMLLIIAGALAGVFGSGPLANATAETSGFRVDYDRFARHGAPTALTAEVAATPRPSGTINLWVDRQFLAGVAVEQVTPEPERVESRGDALWYTFAAGDSVSPTVITLTLRPNRFGSRRVRAGLEGGGSVSFRQFVYP